jgi:serine/threonine-protein kinase
VGHAWRGERDEAFEWLERAFEQRAGGISEIGADLRMRNLRGDPRFAALLQKMNLPAPTR